MSWSVGTMLPAVGSQLLRSATLKRDLDAVWGGKVKAGACVLVGPSPNPGSVSQWVYNQKGDLVALLNPSLLPVLLEMEAEE